MPFATSYTPEPSRCAGGEKPGTRILQDWACDRSPWAKDLYDIGVYVCRTIAGSSTLSQHASGRAADSGHNIVNGKSHPSGVAFALWLVENHAALGIQEVISNRRRWDNQSRGWVRYGGASPHTDHVHWSQNAAGARYLTLAQIEAVAPQEDDLTPEQDARLKRIETHLKHLDPFPPERLNSVGEEVKTGGAMASRIYRWTAETVVKVRTLR